MIHYSCDRCKRMLDSEDDIRYVVKLEVYPAMEAVEVDDIDDDRDHLSEIQDMIERLDDAEIEALSDDLYRKQRYDLCSDCYKEYIKDPVGCEPAIQLDFSQN